MSTAFLNLTTANAKIEGESSVIGHEKWIDVMSWSWQVAAETSWTKGGGASVGKPDPGRLTFTHAFDLAAPALLLRIATGAAFDKAQLVVTPDQQQDAAFSLSLEGVFVTAVRNSYDGDRIIQDVDVVFKTMKIDYRPMDQTGKLGTARSFSWDIPAGKAS